MLLKFRNLIPVAVCLSLVPCLQAHATFLGDLVYCDANANGEYDAGDTPLDGVDVNITCETTGGSQCAVIDTTTGGGPDLSALNQLDRFPELCADSTWNPANAAEFPGRYLGEVWDACHATDNVGPWVCTVTVDANTAPANCNVLVTPIQGGFPEDGNADGDRCDAVDGPFPEGQLIGNAPQYGGCAAAPDVAPGDGVYTIKLDSIYYEHCDLHADFGFKPPPPPPLLASLGDRVWEDLNANGIQDCIDDGNGIIGDDGDMGPECDAGISDLPVNLLAGDCTTPLGQQATTDLNGFYLFPNLAAGDYCVEFVPPGDDFCDTDGFDLGSPLFTAQNQGGDDALDSDADPLTGVSNAVTLAAGDENLTVDAGIFCPAKLGNFVFLDDGDGIQEAGEPGIEGVQVDLFDCGPDGMSGTGDDIDLMLSRTTDMDGFYMFGGEPGVYDLAPGNYYVIFEQPGGMEFTIPKQGGDDATDSDCLASNGLAPNGRTACTGDLGSRGINLDRDCGLITPPPQCNLILDKTCGIAEPPPDDFQCDKPIDELSMIWDGPENNVSIIAYKGDTGAMVLANLGGIMIGNTVTINGFAGSPNDVTWEVFDEFGDKIGDSVFHMSCSDADMNGPEDCGKLAGDGRGSSGGMAAMGGMGGGDDTTDRINQWLFEGMIDSTGTLSCSGGGGGMAVVPTEQGCSFTSASADVTYGYTVTNLGDPVEDIFVTDDQLVGVVGGPVNLDTGDIAQFTAMTTIFGTTVNVATVTGVLSNGANCSATDSVTVENDVPPGSCDDGKATALVFTYDGAPCNATSNYQPDNKGKLKFTCSPSPGVPLGGLTGITIDKDADKVSADIIGNTVTIFRSDTLGEKLAADTKYTLIGEDGNQSQNLHTSCSKPLAVNDKFGALRLIQIINEY